MPSKLKKAIAAVKDQTSISLAKVGGSDASSLEVAILRATTHDEVPVDERHVTEVLQHVSSNRAYAGSCARAIGRRIGRTRNWVVAVKSLMLVLRVFQDGDPHFPKEVLHAMKRGYKILNLSSFRDESTTSCPWDFTAFVRTFALYLDERLDCFLTGKLQRRTSHHQFGKTRGFSRKNVPIVRDMKPSVLLDRISHWQRLLDRAIATRPTGAAKTNRLIQTCLYAIVQETFELYRDISDGLALLLDSFFHLQYNNCVSAFQTCVKASKQFEELCSFYDLCKTIGVGRTSEYPSVQKISNELVNTLQEFLKDQSSFPGTNGRTLGISASLPPLSPKEYDSGSVRQSGLVDRDRSMSEYGGSQCTSLEDLISADPGFSPDRYSDPGRENITQSDEFFGRNDSVSVRSDPTDHRGISSVMDLLSFDSPSPPPEMQNPRQEQGFESDNKLGWELVLFETSNQSYESPSYSNNAPEMDLFSGINVNNPVNNLALTAPLPIENNYTNPFLADTIADLNGINRSEGDLFGSYAHTTTTSFDANFAEGGFPVDMNLVNGSSTTPATFQAEFGACTMNNGSDNFSGGFPTNLGFGRVNSVPTAFMADFGDDFGIGTQSTSTITTSPTFRADFGNTTINGQDHFSESFPSNLGLGPNNSASTTYTANFGDHFGNENNSFITPTFQASTNSRIGNHKSHQSLPNDFFAELGNTNAPNIDQHSFRSNTFISNAPSFGSSSFGPTEDGIANDMNAIVLFNQPSNEDIFAAGPKLQAAPTFRANSIDMDHHNQQNNVSFESDPFTCFTTIPAVEQQQQLWLQNQSKIMARHLT
ncbi:hypothetical protein RND81_11G171900 [Saponaria officinalis]|uniref:ENTH domain-containing protein n=1 Tax=Saponaria officinalis TaxID=3572 RepID=A0AAW1HN93_SAPOF